MGTALDRMTGGATPHHARLVLAGVPGGELRAAAELARQSGAHVTQADSIRAALAVAREQGGDLAMVDVELDIAHFIAALRAERITLPVIACGIEASAERAVAAIRAGARDYVPLPPDRDLIAAAITSVTLRTVEMVGDSPNFRKAVGYATAMARATSPILVRGPSGSGKELVARHIHRASNRIGPFVVTECDGVAADILESELFGHEAGAFPGAIARRAGRLEEGAGGSLFLREIGALSPLLQARLTEALVTGHFTRMGSTDPIPLAVRLIAGTSADLRAQVARGEFRADLMNRLGLIEIILPPLHERGSDVMLLARHFAAARAQDNGLPVPEIDAAAQALLTRHDWPGQVRELEAIIHRAVLLSPGAPITPGSLVLADGMPLAANPSPQASSSRSESMNALVGRSVGDVERELILRTLGHCGGNRTTASSILGISVRTMRNKLREFQQSGYRVG